MATKAKPKQKAKTPARAKSKKRTGGKGHKTAIRGGIDRGGRRWYTDDERENYRAVVVSCGGDCREAARRTGVPFRTLYAWHKGWRCPEALQLCQEKAGKLADAFEELAWLLVAMSPEKADDATLKELVTSAGTAVDKMRILRGESTANISTRNVSVSATLSAETIAANLKRLNESDRAVFTRLLGVVAGGEPDSGGAADHRPGPPGGGQDPLPRVLT